jgi:hypothetical protein
MRLADMFSGRPLALREVHTDERKREEVRFFLQSCTRVCRTRNLKSAVRVASGAKLQENVISFVSYMEPARWGNIHADIYATADATK